MRAAGTRSVDQLLVLLAVVEEGSFTGAARRLGRANSAISYAIDTLEAQLGLALFDRGTTRKPILTRAGEAIVSEARAVALSVETLRARVRGHSNPKCHSASTAYIRATGWRRYSMIFARNSQPGRFGSRVRALEGVEKVVRSGDAWIGVGGLLHIDGSGLQRVQIGAIQIIPVAAPHHPLALAALLPSRALDHVQLVLSDQPAAETRDYGVVGLANWRVGDLTLKHKLLVRGIGWGGMPEPMVRADIASGKLVRLDLRDWRGGEYAMQVVHKIETPPGPAGRWLIGRLVLSSPISGAADP